MNQKLNELKKDIYLMVIEINELPDVSNRVSKMVYFYGIRITWYTETNTYSVKDIYEEEFKEISNRFILTLMIKNLKDLCRKKKKNPELRLTRLRK